MTDRWSIEQVEAVAPSAAAMSAARPLATIGRWHGLGADERAVWGSFHGNSAEPYDTMVDHATVGFSCSCPSRRIPCKHTLALLILWVGGHVVEGAPPASVVGWMARRRPVAAGPSASATAPSVTAPSATAPSEIGAAASAEAESGATDSPAEESSTEHDQGGSQPELPDHLSDHPPDHPPDHPLDHPGGRDDRVARMYDGLNELDRWLIDRMRTGLADPALARFETWDALASRLVDARAGSLANRVRRLSGVVGASSDWHERVLDEIGLLHLLSQAGRRIMTLPDPLADRVATTIGWQVRQQDVLLGVPDTDDWIVAGRSDTREDRIEVRRFWLRGATTNRWALVLSFAAYRQSLDTSLTVGSSFRADLHRYPGQALRALIGDRYGDAVSGAAPASRSIVDACSEIGAMLALEPWLDRLPTVVRASPTRSGGRWALTDDTGTLLLREPSDDGGGIPGLDVLLAVSAGGPIDVTVEWTPGGVVPLTIHTAGGDSSVTSTDIGPRAEPSFVGAA
jgi:SWIM zinc finger